MNAVTFVLSVLCVVFAIMYALVLLNEVDYDENAGHGQDDEENGHG